MLDRYKRSTGKAALSSTGGSAALGLATALLAVAPLVSAGAAGQRAPLHDEEIRSPGLTEAGYLSANALVGGITAGLLRSLRGGSFRQGFVRGAAGGGIVYGGKRLVAATFPGAGFLGREVAAVGTSIVRNAADDRPSLETLVFPVGPLQLHVSPERSFATQIKVDVTDVYWIVYGVVDSRLEFDARTSLSSGTPVFRAPEVRPAHRGRPVLGLALGGVIVLASEDDAVLSHERVHVLQHDFAARAWTEPLDHWLLGHLPREGFRDRLDVHLVMPAFRWSTSWLLGDWRGSPWEAEARFLQRR